MLWHALIGSITPFALAPVAPNIPGTWRSGTTLLLNFFDHTVQTCFLPPVTFLHLLLVVTGSNAHGSPESIPSAASTTRAPILPVSNPPHWK